MNKPEQDAVIDLLRKSWLTHDAMWVAAVYQECGPEVANKLNAKAIQSLTPIETKRFQKVLNLPSVDTFERLRAFVDGAFHIVSGDFTDYRITYPKHNILRWHAAQCFAFEGIKKLGMIDHYQCGILERVEGWFKALQIPYKMLPKIEGCNMHNKGTCELDIQFFFEQ